MSERVAHTGTVGGDAATVRKRWMDAAARRAGIDLATWDTAAGTVPNRATIRASYRYYAELYLAHPEFEWAAMANLIAPTFAAAFDDLARVNASLSGTGSGLWDAARGAMSLVGVPASSIRALEHALLAMQKEIFLDQAVMHEAFMQGGMDAIRELRSVGIIDDHAMRAWQLIDTGRRDHRSDLVSQGNAELLWREQMQIVADDYDAIRALPGGRLITLALSTIGQPAIVGARSAAVFSPRKLAGLSLPISSIDVSVREDRWRMTSGDTLVAFQKLLREQPNLLRRLLQQDLDARIDSTGSALTTAPRAHLG